MHLHLALAQLLHARPYGAGLANTAVCIWSISAVVSVVPEAEHAYAVQSSVMEFLL
jgi:hypothetical protein